MIYVLLLEKQKFYVGYTDRKDGERFMEHFTGQGAKWTQKYKPIEVIEWREGTEADEDNVTLQYMKDYGWWNVRGGRWVTVEMTKPPAELGVKLPAKIEGAGEIVIKKTNVKSNVCFRCGRSGHWADDCFAKTHINGTYLKEEVEYVDEDQCLRCGRHGHWANDCYAKVDVDGDWI